jgi:hypothetical protein
MGICLNMIVRDEAERIERCLESMAPHIECAVIVDTGSSDDTVQITQDALKRLGIQGWVHEREWTDFATARNEALALARGRSDYILIADADQHLEADPGAFAHLTAPLHAYRIQLPGSSHMSARLVRDDPMIDWRWQYPVHEQLVADGINAATTVDATMIAEDAGALRAGRFREDSRVMRAYLAEHPGDGHMLLHLASALHLAGEQTAAVAVWAELATSTDDSEIGRERRYLALVRRAECERERDAVFALALTRAASRLRPQRWEAPMGSVMALRKAGRSHEALTLCDRLVASGLPAPRHEALDVSVWVHEWGIRHVHALLCAGAGRLDEASATLRNLLAAGCLPPEKAHNARENLLRIGQARRREK